MARIRKLEAVKDIIKLGYENGANLEELAQIHGVSLGTIRNILKRQNTQFRETGASRKSKNIWQQPKRNPTTQLIRDKKAFLKENAHITKCEICASDLKSKAVDHCHTSGKLRGILCRACNAGLGMFKDNLQSLQAAINYLTLRK